MCNLSKNEHNTDQLDTHGRCIGLCSECDEHLEQDGRYTTYCPCCNVCPDCGCPDTGFSHYAGCAAIELE